MMAIFQSRFYLQVVDGTGRAANLLSYAWRYLHAESYDLRITCICHVFIVFFPLRPDSKSLSIDELQQLVMSHFPKLNHESMVQITQDLLECMEDKSKVWACAHHLLFFH